MKNSRIKAVVSKKEKSKTDLKEPVNKVVKKKETQKRKDVSVQKEGVEENRVKENEIRIGPPKLTRYERARIIGSRSLQLALGAPPFIPIEPGEDDPISIAIKEVDSKALPISIRRILPDNSYQDISVEYIMQIQEEAKQF